jgi:hypothetical protein
MTKRGVIISDPHCGHPLGLVPPEWQRDSLQQKFWEWYAKKLVQLYPIDFFIINGDAIDGSGKINAGSELLVSNRDEQVCMAIRVALMANANKYIVVTGSPYHTGKSVDLEKHLASYIGGSYHDKLTLFVNGLKLNIRHHVARSTIPHGRHTQVSRAKMWDNLENAYKGEDKSDILIRSHVHYCAWSGTPLLGESIITPCLQLNSRYGSKVCEGNVDVGFLSFDITDKENYSWTKHLLKPTFRPESKLII